MTTAAEVAQVALDDFAILTGGTVFTSELDTKLERATVYLLGSTGPITITMDNTIVLNCEGSKPTASKFGLSSPTPPHPNLTARSFKNASLSFLVASLSSRSVVLPRLKSVRRRTDTTMRPPNATRATVEEGIFPGGGVALPKASLQLAANSPGSGASSTASPVSADAKSILTHNFDQELGVTITRRALTPLTCNPHRRRRGSQRHRRHASLPVRRCGQVLVGIWRVEGEYVDMIKAGIVDPLRVVRTALVDASGVASLLTTSESVCG